MRSTLNAAALLALAAISEASPIAIHPKQSKVVRQAGGNGTFAGLSDKASQMGDARGRASSDCNRLDHPRHLSHDGEPFVR